MGHLVAKEDWGVVDLNTTTGRVFVQEDWLYTWLLYPGVASHWTLAEKRLFHHRVDIGVWKLWSNHLILNVSGTAPFPARRVPVNFDVRWKTQVPINGLFLPGRYRRGRQRPAQSGARSTGMSTRFA